MVLSPGGLFLIVLMPIMGKLVSKIDTRWLIGFGLAVSGSALLYMTGFDLQVSYGIVAMSRVVQAAGLAFLFIPINVSAYVGVPPEKNNMATALVNLSRNLGGSVGISIVQTVFARRAQFHQSMITEGVTAFSRKADALLDGLTQHFSGAGSSDASQQAQAALYGIVQQQS